MHNATIAATFLSEASKYLMQYVAAVSGKGYSVDRVKEQLLHSNPVLEGKSNPVLEGKSLTQSLKVSL